MRVYGATNHGVGWSESYFMFFSIMYICESGYVYIRNGRERIKVTVYV